jgi:hypothetical protein
MMNQSLITLSKQILKNHRHNAAVTSRLAATIRTLSTVNPSAKLSSTSKFNDLEPIDKKDNIISVRSLHDLKFKLYYLEHRE